MLEIESDPYSIFVFAMNAPQTKEKYVTRLKRFAANILSRNAETRMETSGF
jgi:hypothetical protein